MDKNQNGINDKHETLAHMLYGFACFGIGTVGFFWFDLSPKTLITLVSIGAALIVEDSLRKAILNKIL